MVALHQPANGNMEMVLDWHTLLTRERLGKSAHSSDELGRSPFHKDHDRIIFSGAFRRLGRKTRSIRFPVTTISIPGLPIRSK